MSDNDLTLEKINAERITSLEDRLEKSVHHLEQKIDRVLEFVSKRGNGNIGSYIAMGSIAVSLFAMLQIQMIGMMEIVNKTTDVVHEIRLDIKDIDSRHPPEWLIDKIDAVKEDLSRQIELRSNDRFTGAEGAMLKDMQSSLSERVERLEGAAGV